VPVDDYLCHDCHKDFEKVLTLTELDLPVTCPKCRSKNVEQEAKAFFAVTSKKS
jgi:putative FmdB family regulatory protein